MFLVEIHSHNGEESGGVASRSKLKTSDIPEYPRAIVTRIYSQTWDVSDNNLFHPQNAITRVAFKDSIEHLWVVDTLHESFGPWNPPVGKEFVQLGAIVEVEIKFYDGKPTVVIQKVNLQNTPDKIRMIYWKEFDLIGLPEGDLSFKDPKTGKYHRELETSVGKFAIQYSHECEGKPEYRENCCGEMFVLTLPDGRSESHGGKHCCQQNWSGSACSYASTCGWTSAVVIDLKPTIARPATADICA